jgi:hypothetical protein
MYRIHMVMCRVVRVTIMTNSVRMIGFIGTSITISLNYNNYNAIAILHTLQFTVARTHTKILRLH